MKISHLDGDTLSQALQSGIHNVIADQAFLNNINVFPVADGDTGTNLSLSLSASLGVLQAPGEQHLGTMLAAMADALLDGARGNSGAIMAQFFQGVSDSAGELTRFTTTTFSKAVRTGSDYAHDALSNPVEGTILSVIEEFAINLEQQDRGAQESDLAAVFAAAMPGLEEALAQTSEQLDVLRKAGVVDAGAKGFVDLVSGMNKFFSDGQVIPMPDAASSLQANEINMPNVSGEKYEYRYCTECMVTGMDIDRRKLREALASLGGSLVLAGTKRKAKIHIHANDAQAVFDLARDFGDVSAEKADDLQLQQSSSQRTQKNFAVITDSAADIADADMERLDIHMVPCRIQFGDRGYLDKVSITSDEFYEQLTNNPHHPTTSQPAPGDFRRQYQYLASHFPDVISINLTRAASGTYEAALSAANRTEASGDIHVLNSKNASLGQGLLVVFAAECGAAGLSAQTTISAVEELIPQTSTYGVLGNLDYAVRGGRIPKWVKMLADSMRVTPIVRTTATGEIKLSKCLFGRRNIAARFAQHVCKEMRNKGPMLVAVGNAACPERGEVVVTEMKRVASNIEKMSRAELGTALGVHGGPDMLIIATQPYVNPSSLAE